MRCNVWKHSLWYDRQVNVQINLRIRIRAGWPDSSLAVFGISKDAKIFNVFDEDSDQIGWNRKLIWIFILHIQYNLNGSNTDGSFTGDDSNSFFSPSNFFQ